MGDAWNRLGVFLDLREDPELEERRKGRGPRHWAGRILKAVRDLALFFAVGVALFCLVALIVHLIGGDTSPRGILDDGLRFFGVAWGLAVVVFILGRWVYWIADRWI